jgi:flagellar protein FlbD
MIKLCRFKTHDHDFVLNADLIETIEQTPDTVITLTNGKKIIVCESTDEVVRRVMEYKRAIYRNSR